MFTGIIQKTGRVHRSTETDSGHSILIAVDDWNHHPAIGSSIAVDGCCLTVTDLQIESTQQILHFDVIHQTLRETTIGRLQADHTVNLERAATPTTFLDGHIVQGHIDGVGSAVRLEPDNPGEVRLQITPPADLMPYFIPRGSVTLDGVSLTLAEVGQATFTVALIPTTLQWTNLDRIKHSPIKVNIETDCLVRAVIHHLERTRAGQ